ncbi:MAG: hypothetical protein ACLRWQ_10730 [Flavonifractor plautii]
MYGLQPQPSTPCNPCRRRSTGNDRPTTGAYLNRFLSGYLPAGIRVQDRGALAAAHGAHIPDLSDRTWTCTGSVQVGDGTIICPGTHGEQDISSALANSLQRGVRPAGRRAGARRCWRSTRSRQGSPAAIRVSGLHYRRRLLRL